MNSPFKALYSESRNDQIHSAIQKLSLSDLPEGDLLIRAEYSSVNYKDALAVTGKGKIFRRLPLVGGIDVAGEVLQTNSPDFRIGQKVLITGCGLGEERWGGYSEYVRVPKDIVIPLPEGLTSREAMILGTAGFTAALCLWRFLKNDQVPQMGPIVVTGATGGVGSFAIQLFSHLGFEVWAVSGRPEHFSYLKELGASECYTPEELKLGTRPLESVRFGGVVDNVGGEMLAGLCRHVQLWGNVGCIGLAGGADLKTTVMPHILRGVSLLGISSNNCQKTVRTEIWKRLSQAWKPSALTQIVKQEITLNEILPTAENLLNRKLLGRILIRF